MNIKKPNPISHLLNFKKELWISDYSTRMQKWFSGQGLPPIRIDAEVHRRCNCHCIHCVRRRSKKDLSEESKEIEVDINRWYEIAEESGEIGVKSWNIAGIGEPMVNQKSMIKLMRIIKRHNMFGEITSNGTLWTRNIIKEIVRIKWDSICISIDAPSSKIHNYIRQFDAFDKATRTVKLLNYYRRKYQLEIPCITINMVLNALNYHTLPKMIDFVSKLGADALFVEPMIVYTKFGEKIKLNVAQTKKLPKIINQSQKIADRVGIELFISCLEGEDEAKEFNKNLVEKTGNIKHEIHKRKNVNCEKQTQTLIEEILDIPCYYPWFYLIITADGSVAHCGECDNKTDNIKDKGIREIWFGKNMDSVRNAFLNKNLPYYCNKCRPNVIGDLNLVRKSIREYGNLNQVQKKLIILFKENLQLLEQLYYLNKGMKPHLKKRNLLNRIKTYWI